MHDDLHTTITALAQSFANPAETQLPFLEQLCTVSEQYWRTRLQSDVKPSDCRDAFLCAAALSALADWYTSQTCEVSSFSVGSVSVSSASAADSTAHADALRALANRIMSPWCQLDDFDFRGVRS